MDHDVLMAWLKNIVAALITGAIIVLILIFCGAMA